jgi:hypothetical protein
VLLKKIQLMSRIDALCEFDFFNRLKGFMTQNGFLRLKVELTNFEKNGSCNLVNEQLFCTETFKNKLGGGDDSTCNGTCLLRKQSKSMPRLQKSGML